MGQPYCMGANHAGQLGDGTRGGLGITQPLFVKKTQPNSSLVVQEGRFCVRNPSRTSCWGPDVSRRIPSPFCRLGDDGQVECKTGDPWQQLTTDAKIHQVVGGDRFGCWLDAQGNVYCVGQGLQGELGNGELTASTTAPLWIPGLKQAAQLAAGQDFVCALEVIGNMKCWGSGLRGQLGTGRYRSSPQPVEVSVLQDVEEISAGRAHMCARRQNGQVWCWGDLYSGAEGTPRLLSLDARVIQLASQDGTTCARSADDRIYCWGKGSQGELGQPQPLQREAWTAVVGLSSL